MVIHVSATSTIFIFEPIPIKYSNLPDLRLYKLNLRRLTLPTDHLGIAVFIVLVLSHFYDHVLVVKVPLVMKIKMLSFIILTI